MYRETLTLGVVPNKRSFEYGGSKTSEGLFYGRNSED